MTYYSCPDFYWIGIKPILICFFIIAQERLSLPVALACGPRGIRTPDLLNAIETRSQLRYGPGPIFNFGFSVSDWRLHSKICGPEGIRTPDFLSAIEARSQLRYRPRFIVPLCGIRRRTFYLRHRGMS